jgi:hypothetical protein
MFENFKDDINTKRETNKIGLETFALDRYNILDRPIDKLIKELKKDLENEYSEHQKWIDMETNNPEKFQELEEQAERTGHSLYFQMHDYIRTVIYIEEELTTLFEMKIIYAFKHLEIEIKNLISASFNDNSIGKLSKWDNLIQFLKSKKINISEIKDYREVNQLRTVNNSLKHSNEQIDNSLKGIEEFKEVESVTYDVLEKFYKRIKESSNSFLSSLSVAIYKNLYEFDDDKLERISISIALRMDEQNAKKLIEKIKNKYE